jgi:hypothetical protein
MALLNRLTVREAREVEVRQRFFDSWYVATCVAVVVLLGAIDALSGRHNMGPDGISYLDMSDSIRRGDWANAVNAYWAPLYPVALARVLALLKPSAYWEFSAAQVANFLIYMGALAAFSLFLNTFIAHVNYLDKRSGDSYGLPKWLWVILGYTLFAWCSIELIGMGHISPDLNHPDMLLSIFLYCAATILLRIRMGSANWQAYCLLGIALGVGYLVKGPMFPIGIAFLVASVIAAGNLARGFRLGFVAAVLFLALSSPFIYKISKATGHLTFGDNAVINYTSNVNRLPKYYWHSSPAEPLSSRTYPAKQLFAYPAVYQFTMPLRGTYVYWYNPAEWYRGTKPEFSWKDNSRQLLANLHTHYILLFHMIPAVTLTILTLMIFNHSRGRSVIDDLRRQWVVLAVPLCGLIMYTLVYFEFRHVGSLILLLLLGLFGSTCLPDSRESQLATSALVLGVTIMMAFQLLSAAISGIGSLNLAEFSDKTRKTENVQWQIADELHRTGLQPGDKVAWLRPDHFDATDNYWWARLGRFQVVAEIADNAAFWSVDDPTRSEAIHSVSQAGVKALVISGVPKWVKLPAFVKLGATGYYVYLFREESSQPKELNVLRANVTQSSEEPQP